MKVLLTGSRGQLGIELAKQLKAKNIYKVIATDREELNIVKCNRAKKFSDSM